MWLRSSGTVSPHSSVYLISLRMMSLAPSMAGGPLDWAGINSHYLLSRFTQAAMLMIYTGEHGRGEGGKERQSTFRRINLLTTHYLKKAILATGTLSCIKCVYVHVCSLKTTYPVTLERNTTHFVKLLHDGNIRGKDALWFRFISLFLTHNLQRFPPVQMSYE